MIRLTQKTYYILTGLALITILLLIDISDLGLSKPDGNISCHYKGGSNLSELTDEEALQGNNIFFHETSCAHEDGILNLSSRQACAIESASRANPDSVVFVLVSAPVKSLNNLYVQQLLRYPNIRIRHISIKKYFAGTPLEKLHSSGSLNRSMWPLSHTSDVLRYATLYKYGGTYLDLDVVVMKSFQGMKNFAGAESGRYINAAIINLSQDKVGRELAEATVHELSKSFRGDVWGYNGPGVITRVLRYRCQTMLPSKMTNERCKQFTVYPPYMFYPVTHMNWNTYFSMENVDQIMEELKRSHTVHIWNKKSTNALVRKYDDTPYTRLAKTFCPRVYESIGIFV